MRNKIIPNLILIILVYILISSCSSMNQLTMSVIEPAPVYFPSEIQSVGLINKSVSSEENKDLDKMDRIFTLEGKDLDKKGAQESIVGLYDELLSSQGFTNIKIIDDTERKKQESEDLQSPLSWERLSEICIKNKVDAIFSLSYYDTDATIDYKMIPIEITTPVGITMPAIEHQATISTKVKTGWMIYYPVNKMVLDDFEIYDNVTLQGAGINPAKAAEAILNREKAVMHVSNNIGHNYAQRIFPYKVRVSRDYFVRGTDNFKIAKRRAQTGNWDGAAELWELEITNPKPKVAGRACYNMAIINEINGELEIAIDWASKSYVDYNNKDALRYLNILNRRVVNSNQIQQ
ncbi:MAG: DUF6340 family protein [Bacteroidales bacterium]|nr:DUF6340 family protein [Bacteroidales bacterium]